MQGSNHWTGSTRLARNRTDGSNLPAARLMTFSGVWPVASPNTERSFVRNSLSPRRSATMLPLLPCLAILMAVPGHAQNEAIRLLERWRTLIRSLFAESHSRKPEAAWACPRRFTDVHWRPRSPDWRRRESNPRHVRGVQPGHNRRGEQHRHERHGCTATGTICPSLHV